MSSLLATFSKKNNRKRLKFSRERATLRKTSWMPKKSAKSSKRGKVKAKGSVEVVEADDDANYTKRPLSHRRCYEYVVPYKWSFEKCPKRGNANESRSRERSESSSKSDSPLDPSDYIHKPYVLLFPMVTLHILSSFSSHTIHFRPSSSWFASIEYIMGVQSLFWCLFYLITRFIGESFRNRTPSLSTKGA